MAKNNKKTAKQPNKQPNKQAEETFQLGGTIYLKSSLTEKAKGLFDDIARIEGVILQKQLEVSISQVARSKIIEEIQKEEPNFTAVGKVGE